MQDLGQGVCAPVCSVITPGSETKVGVAQIMWYFGHIHEKGDCFLGILSTKSWIEWK